MKLDDMTVDDYLEIIPRDFIDKIEVSNSLRDFVIIHIRVDDFTQNTFKSKTMLGALEDVFAWLLRYEYIKFRED